MFNFKKCKSKYNQYRSWPLDTIEWRDIVGYAAGGLIIKNDEWGIDITNRSGGWACNSPIQRGIYIPLMISSNMTKICRDTLDVFQPYEFDQYVTQWEKHRNTVFKPIERYLGYFIKVDPDGVYDNRNPKENSTQESWVNVICHKNHDASEGILKHWDHEKFKAVLLTLNSY